MERTILKNENTKIPNTKRLNLSLMAIALSFLACQKSSNDGGDVVVPVPPPPPPGYHFFTGGDTKVGNGVGRIYEINELKAEVGLEIFGDLALYNQYPNTGYFGYNGVGGQIYAHGFMQVLSSSPTVCDYDFQGIDAFPPGLYEIIPIALGYFDYATGEVSGLKLQAIGMGRTIDMFLNMSYFQPTMPPYQSPYFTGTFNWWIQGINNLEIIAVNGVPAPFGCAVSLYHAY